MIPMKKLILVLALALLVLAGCSSSGGDKWGGYTEAEAKNILSSESVRNSVLTVSPFDPQGRPYTKLLPTKGALEKTDLRKATLQGQEAWGYEDKLNSFCLYVWKDPQTKSFTTFVGCNAD
jgi:hypothetical protein